MSKEQIEKQAIEDMAKVIEITEQIARDAHCGYPSPGMIATDLYEKGWRKQSAGEWVLEHETYGRMLCSNCNKEAPIKYEYNDERKGHLVYVKSSFCPNCGSHMSGGKE